MMKNFKQSLLLSLVLALAGCSAYGPLGKDGGYSQSRLGEDEYLVHYDSRKQLSKPAVDEMALLHAADLTIEKGYKFFAIKDKDSTYEETVVPNANYTNPLDPVMVNRRRISSLNIVMLHDKSNPKALDARKISNDLGPKYK